MSTTRRWFLIQVGIGRWNQILQDSKLDDSNGRNETCGFLVWKWRQRQGYVEWMHWRMFSRNDSCRQPILIWIDLWFGVMFIARKSTRWKFVIGFFQRGTVPRILDPSMRSGSSPPYADLPIPALRGARELLESTENFPGDLFQKIGKFLRIWREITSLWSEERLFWTNETETLTT